MALKILVTGGLGFIGSAFIRRIIQRSPRGVTVVNLDAMKYSANPANLSSVDQDKRYSFVHGDIAGPEIVREVIKDVDVVVNFAAATHVDRSIQDSSEFVRTNVLGTQTLLEAARQSPSDPVMVQISTDEVYGEVLVGHADEIARLDPRNPYAATKAAADHLTQAYYETYGLRTIITRSSNNFGPYQFPEKLVPLAITNLIDGLKIPVYGNGQQERDWIPVDENVAVIHFLITKMLDQPALVSGETYNIGSKEGPEQNLNLLTLIHNKMGKDPRQTLEFVKDRPGHDRRYSVSTAKIEALGWPINWQRDLAMRDTVAWYRANASWWRPLKERSAAWYASQYPTLQSAAPSG